MQKHMIWSDRTDIGGYKLLEARWYIYGMMTAQRSVTQKFDVFFDLRLNKRLSK